MKKFLLLAGIVAMMASCTTTTKTARTQKAPCALYNATAVDLQVAPQRVKYTLTPSKEIRKGGLENCKEAAIMECLEECGNADLLVEPEFVYSIRKGLFGTTVKSVTVTGRPAIYKNFRSLNDSVFANPVFRSTSASSTSGKSGFSLFKKK